MVIQNTPTKIDKIASLRIGQRGENLATDIKMDVSDWITVHPDANYYCLFKRPDEVQVQPVLSSLEEDVLTWTVRAWECAVIGVGYLEVRAVNPDTGLVAKSRVIPCAIEDSVIDDEGPVPPEMSWVGEVLAAKDTAVAAKTAAEEARDTAQTTVNGAIAGIQAEGQTQVGVVQAEGTTQVGAVQSEGTTQVGAVQAKGTEVLNSIPSDYSELSDDVTDLKSALNEQSEEIENLQSIVIIDQDTDTTSGEDVPLSDTNGYIKATDGALVSTSAGRATDYIDIPAYSKTVTGKAFLYHEYGVAFYSATKTYISGVSGYDGTSKTTPQSFTLEIPENAVYIRWSLSYDDSQIPEDFAVTFNILDTIVDELTEELADKIDIPSNVGTEGQVLALNSLLQPIWKDAGLRTRTIVVAGADVAMGANGYLSGEDGSLTSTNAAKCADYYEIPVGDQVTVSGKACLYNAFGVAFYNASKQYISGISGTSIGTSSLSPQNFSISVPATAKYMRWSLVVDNSQIPGDFGLTFTVITSLSDDVAALENQVSSIEDEIEDKIDTPAQAGTAGQALILNSQGVPVWGTATTPAETQTITIDGSDIDEGSHGFIKGTNGKLDGSSAATSTDYIEIPSNIGGKASGKACLYNDYGIAFYNASKTFISGVTGTSTGTSDLHTQEYNVTIPETAKYMRFSFLTEYASLPNDFTVVFTIPVQTNVIDMTNKIRVMDNAKLNAGSGVITSSSTWITTDYIQITDVPRISIQVTTYETAGLAFYDAGKNYISGISGETTGETSSLNSITKRFDVPAGTHFIRSTLYKNQNTFTAADFCVLFFDLNAETDQVVQYINVSSGNGGHNILILGDSYSKLGDWVRGLCSGLDVTEVVNLGVTSATVRDRQADRTQYPYTDRPTSSGTGNQNTLASQVQKLKRLKTGTDLDAGEVQIYADHSPDVIIIEGGMNDWYDNETKENAYPQQFITQVNNVYYKNSAGTVTQGNYHIKTDIETVDRTSFAGAYRYIVEELLTLFQNAQVFIVTTSRFNYFVDNPQVYDRIAAQQIKCARYCGATVIDWNGEGNISTITDCPTGSGTQEDPYTVYGGTLNTVDGLHPNARGGRTYGRLAANVIKQRFADIGKTG